MQTYSLQVIHPFKELFLQEDFSKIPDITLKSNSDLNLIASDVKALSVTFVNVPDPQEQTEKVFNAIAGYFEDTSNIFRTQSIEYLSKGFIANIEKSYRTIDNTVIPTVEMICNLVKDRYKVLMTREKAEGLLIGENVEATESDYSFVRWGSLTSPTVCHTVMEIACENAGIKEPALSTMNLAYITRKADFSKDFYQLTFSQDVREGLLAKLNESMVNDSTGMSAADVEYFFNMFSDKGAYIRLLDGVNRTFNNDVRGIVDNCIKYTELSDKIMTAASFMPKILSDSVNTDTLTTMAENIENVKKTVYALQYWMLFNKEQRFGDKLILKKDTLNKPVYNEFIMNGGTIADVHNYLKAFHLDSTIPMNGVSIETVRKADTTSRINKAYESLKANESVIKTKCLFGAYEHAFNEVIKNGELVQAYPHLKDPGFLAQLSNDVRKRSAFLGGDISNLENVVYEVIISSLHKGDLVENMYKHIGAGFSNLMESTEDITDSKVIEAQCFALADLLTDYLFEKVVEK
jgi:hypothetical protein